MHLRGVLLDLFALIVVSASPLYANAKPQPVDLGDLARQSEGKSVALRDGGTIWIVSLESEEEYAELAAKINANGGATSVEDVALGMAAVGCLYVKYAPASVSTFKLASRVHGDTYFVITGTRAQMRLICSTPDPGVRLPRQLGMVSEVAGKDLATILSAAGARPAASSGAMPDMAKVGPISRIPRHEIKDQEEIATFFKTWMEVAKKGDEVALADMVDFPVIMMTDGPDGAFEMVQFDRDRWVRIMKPSLENPPKDMSSSHRHQCHMLSDDLASCEGEDTLAIGNVKGKTNSQMLLVRKNGKWKAKTMVEAGWGGLGPEGGAQGTGK